MSTRKPHDERGGDPTQLGAPDHVPTPSEDVIEGRPFSLEMIHSDLMEIRESLARIDTGGDHWSSAQARPALDKADHLTLRIAVERAMGNAAR